MDVNALDVATTRTMSVVLMVVLALIAVAVVLLIGKFLLRVAVVAVLVLLGIAVYDQRAELTTCPQTCSCSFFGYQLEMGSNTINDACRNIVGQVREPGT